MSMQLVSYQGYGIDLVDIVEQMESPAKEDFTSFLEYGGYDLIGDICYTVDTDADIILPCKTENFTCLFLLANTYVVGDTPPKTYSKSEANQAICTDVRTVVDKLVSMDAIPQDLADAVVANAAVAIVLNADYDNGRWTDYI